MNAENEILTENKKIVDWILKYQATSDVDIKKQLINFVFLSYRKYLKSLVHSFARRSNDPYDDLFQVASIGLIKAMESFDKKVNENFKTYATQSAVGEIRHYLRDKTAIIRAPREMRELSFRIHKMTLELTQKLGYEPSNEEVALALKVSQKKVQEARNLERRTTPVSIEQLNLVSESHFQDSITRGALDEYKKMLADFENEILIKDAIKRLDEMSQTIIKLSFFDELNYAQIAARLDINPMTVSRRVKRALDKLCNIITDKGRENYGND